ncbi:MAG TPA: phosphatase PAP2 family protein [Sedimentisphaerales bacterium]|nr:phosphatase PAP2 family protein [Sedimentisphaerales bacterium]
MSAVLHKTNYWIACSPVDAFAILTSVVILILFFVAGCGTLPNGRRWGQDAFFPVDADRVSRAAHDAFFSSNTLVPLASALVLSIDDFDERVSDWAVKHNPVFGSEANARDASDYLRTTLRAEAIITAIATPSGDVPEQWMVSKAKGLGVELAAIGATSGVTDLLKVSTDRTRPDKSGDRSFPSGHASGTFSYMTFANRNINSIDMPQALKPPLKIGNFLLASGVAWARVEGQRHYPSDVLAGAALGHFLTAFIHDAFMNLPEDGNVDFVIFPVRKGAGMALAFRF